MEAFTSARGLAAAGRGAGGRAALVFAVRNFEEIVSSVALVIVVLAVCWGVVTRYVTTQPAAWSGEVAGIAFAWLVFIGASAGFKHNMHVSIDLVMRRVPPRIARPVALAVDVLLVLFCAYVAVLGLRFTIASWDNPTSVLRWPESVLYAPVALGFALMAVRYAQAAVAQRRTREGN